MAEGCPVKTKLEQDCHPSCLKYWNEYESCKTRINSYDSWEYDKLKHLAEHHGLPTKDSSRNDLDKSSLVENIKAVANCTGQYFDYFKCLDKCVAPKLFKHLK
eukprot:TRINITY_DN25407_c0_g1_i1.p1 TRINITY_DN25407_c0_g1~~TRINITY_DN25407_c0_g1_i1.p1  ORF type:complete len:103 (-),score=14.08 TRINITY_DN25407_c0_g1_i1:70-378(-)